MLVLNSTLGTVSMKHHISDIYLFLHFLCRPRKYPYGKRQDIWKNPCSSQDNFKVFHQLKRIKPNKNIHLQISIKLCTYHNSQEPHIHICAKSKILASRMKQSISIYHQYLYHGKCKTILCALGIKIMSEKDFKINVTFTSLLYLKKIDSCVFWCKKTVTNG